MQNESKVLIVDDDELMQEYLQDALSKYNVYTVGNIRDAKKIVKDFAVDLLITDIKLNGGSGIDLIREFRQNYPTIPTILITGYPGEEYVKIVEEMEVDTFLTKPISPNQIRVTVLKGLEKRKQYIENSRIENLTDKNRDLGLIGSSQYIINLRKKIHDLASGDFPIIIQGPSGTGKEIVANSIHSNSKRKNIPMVTINCAAIPKDLEEAEFFGYTRGSFTGAYSARNGIMAAANNTTLFLDEVSELSLGVQAKLLRVLENGEFFRIGEATARKVNIRFITATNRNIKEMVEKGTFRDDLFFRLGFVISTKPLNQHREDIPLISKHFINLNNKNNPRCPKQITAEALGYLVDYNWRGNVRELKQTLSLLCHLAMGKKRINISDVKSILNHKENTINSYEFYSTEKFNIIKEFEIDYFTKLLKKYSGNMTQAAKASGMHRPNLIKKLKNLGISSSDFKE